MTAARSAADEPASGPADDTPAAASTPHNGAAPSGWTVQMNALGEFIRAQRQLANLSLREMASMTSVSNAYLSQVERGLHQPSLKVLHSIAAALQLSTEQLLAQGGWASGAREAAGVAVPRRPSARTLGSLPSSARPCWAYTAASSIPSESTRRCRPLGPASHET